MNNHFINTSFHKPDAIEILAESEHAYIGYCTCCDEFNFAFKNLVLAFQQEELLRFGQWLIEYRYHRDTYLPLPHGSSRAYRSPLTNLFIVFTDDELDEVENLFAQLMIILEARYLIRGDHHATDFPL